MNSKQTKNHSELQNSRYAERVSDDTILKYGKYAYSAYKVSNTSWPCLGECSSSVTSGTVVDYHWDTSSISPSYGFVAHNPDSKEIVVSFRGSSELLNWIADFTLMPVPWPTEIAGSTVHEGFLRTYQSASDQIKQVVSNLTETYPDYKIAITGHSLGGAQAAIAAVDFILTEPEWKSKIELYTFGEPRVGSPELGDWMASQMFPIFRIVNKGDMVTQVPSRSRSYQHHSQEVWYTNEGSVKFCGNNPENPECQDKLTLIQLNTADHLEYPGFGILFPGINTSDFGLIF